MPIQLARACFVLALLNRSCLSTLTLVKAECPREGSEGRNPDLSSLLVTSQKAIQDGAHPRALRSRSSAFIPRKLLFNYKINLFNAADYDLDEHEKLLRENLRHTVKVFSDIPPADVHFWDDAACLKGLQELDIDEDRSKDWSSLAVDFAHEEVGMVKSDLCRLVMLYNIGGLYFDTDIVPLPQLPMSLLPGATFVTVEAVNVSGGGFFQAFLATTPKHPVIRKALKEFQSWYRVFFTPGQDQEQLRHSVAHGNIGCGLLAKAFKEWSGKDEITPVMLHGQGHASQFFVETVDSNVSGFQGNLSGTGCDWSVVDELSKTVVLFSRIYDRIKGVLCQQKADAIALKFGNHSMNSQNDVVAPMNNSNVQTAPHAPEIFEDFKG